MSKDQATDWEWVEIDTRELSDDVLEQLAGGAGRKLLCSRGTRRVCGTRMDPETGALKYDCRCE